MGKRRDTLETTVLALELLRRIPRATKVTASELQQQLAAAGIKRELRTIQRQLDTLSQHFDIERDSASKPFGYRWLPKAEGLSMPVLSEQESLLLRLAEEHLRHLLPPALMKSMAGFFEQARSNLAFKTTAREAREWLSKVRVVSTTLPLIPPTVKPAVFEQVSEALYANRWLNLEYKNLTGEVAKSDVMPLGLAQQGPRLYLVARYRGHDNERSLAMHRIVSAKASTLTFKRPLDFDLKRYDADGRFSFGEGRRIRLSFEIDQELGFILEESPLSKDQVLQEAGGTLKVTATVVESILLDRWLFGFGRQVRNIKRKPIRPS